MARLHHYFEDALKSNGDNIYLRTTSRQFTYKEVYELAVTFENILRKEGIQKNDRVIIYSAKNAASIALMIACSKCDCIYVPVSSSNPAERAKFIINETTARFILCDTVCEPELLKTELTIHSLYSSEGVNLYSLSPERPVSYSAEGVAFILFTSGSTGTPKGVVISHDAAIAFIDWAAEEFYIWKDDIVSSIAPFNFDLSVFDIYVTAKKCASLFLYSDEEIKNALLMGQRISTDKITTIYATPTFFSTLAHYGKLRKYDYSSLKNVLFAGEVFHLEIFKTLLEHWPKKNFANLYGPTETNVCTFYRVDIEKMESLAVFPIGKNCDYASLLVVDENGNEIQENYVEGELLVAGKSLFYEYWNDQQKTAESTFTDKSGTRYYRTGDIVIKSPDDNLEYVARKDRMIKKNGFRIEPLEVEKVILMSPYISNVAVILSRENNQLVAFLEWAGHSGADLSWLKLWCLRHLPLYMIPDKFVVLDSMPVTSSGKIDLQALEKSH